jgi:hypothetical protein
MRGLVIVALTAGLVGGLLLGGRAANIGRHPIRRPAALALGVGSQGLAVLLDVTGAGAAALLVASYTGLATFALANLAFLGMGLVGAGLALNGLVMALNGGMPVREAAILAASDLAPDDLADLSFGPKHHLERPDGRVTGLGDVVPLRPTGEVVSIGDLVMAAGVAVVVARLLLPPVGGTAGVRRWPARRPSRDAPV